MERTQGTVSPGRRSCQYERLRDLIGGKVPAKDLTQWVQNAEATIKNLKTEEAAKWWQSLAEAAVIAGQEDLAQTCLEKSGSSAGLQRLGDLLADKKQWGTRRAGATHRGLREKPIGSRRWLLFLSGGAAGSRVRKKEGKSCSMEPVPLLAAGK